MILADCLPEALADTPWAAGVFLRECVILFFLDPESLPPELVDSWRTVCRGHGDLSWASDLMGQLKARDLGRLLKVLSSDPELFGIITYGFADLQHF